MERHDCRPRPPALPRHAVALHRSDHQHLDGRDRAERGAMRAGISRLFLLTLTLLLIAACSRQPETGPVEIKWDRDTCKRCSMAISDRLYAVEVRGGPKREVFKFDDVEIGR